MVSGCVSAMGLIQTVRIIQGVSGSSVCLIRTVRP
jgi:hypothetical protein